MSKREKDITERIKGKKTAASEFTKEMNGEANQENNINKDNNEEINSINEQENNNNINVDSNEDSNEENNIDNEVNNNDGFIIETYEDIDNKFKQQKKEKPKKKQQVIYLDEAVAKSFDKWAKKHGKGAKSELIETLLKNFLKQNS